MLCPRIDRVIRRGSPRVTRNPQDPHIFSRVVRRAFAADSAHDDLINDSMAAGRLFLLNEDQEGAFLYFPKRGAFGAFDHGGPQDVPEQLRRFGKDGNHF